MNGVNGAGEPRQSATELFDLQDMQPYDPTQEIIFPPELKVRR